MFLCRLASFSPHSGFITTILIIYPAWVAPAPMVCAQSSCPPQQKLIPSEPSAAGDYFGYQVAISGDWLVVGAPGADLSPPSGLDAGAVYVFQRNNGVWTEFAKLIASDADSYDNLGGSVAIDGDQILVGAANDESCGSYEGSAYVFRFTGSSWIEEAKLCPSAGGYYAFGAAVAITGNLACVGAFSDQYYSGATGYVFEFDGSMWVQGDSIFIAPSNSYSWTGKDTISAQGDTIVIGLEYDDTFQISGGSVYVRRKQPDDSWLTYVLVPDDLSPGDRFGSAVSLSDDVLLVGSPGDDDVGYGGSVYINRSIV